MQIVREMLKTKQIASFLYILSCLFIIGTILFIPFPYYLFPNIGKLLSPFTIPFLEAIWGEKNLSLDSDAKGMLLWIPTWLLISLLLAILLHFWKKIENVWGVSPVEHSETSHYMCTLCDVSFLNMTKMYNATFKPYFSTFIAYYLALQLFRYGWDKVFKHQFYQPEPNILFTPLGDLDKDILYWTVMGRSYSFSVFGGLMEIIPAILLLFRPTRLLGAIIAFGVMLQVVMINMGFDITVKCLSSFLLLLSSFLIYPHIPQLIAFFLKGKPAQLSFSDSLPFPKYPTKLYFLLKYSLVALILLETLYPFLLSNNWNDDKATRQPYHGAYQVENFWLNGESLSCENTKTWKRVFFHRKSYFIIQNQQDKMQDYACDFDTISGKLSLYDTNQEEIGKFIAKTSKDFHSLTFAGILRADSIRFGLRKIE